MFDLGTDWWEIVIRSAVVYAALLVGLRLTGKRQIGQMAPFDLVVILLIANAVQNAMVGPDTSLLGGLISAGVLLGANIVVARSRDRIPGLRRALEGQPTVLISDGKVIPRAIADEQIDMDELEQAIREHGIETLKNVKMAVLEVDGTISIVPMGTETIRTHRRFRQQHHQN
ncbi:MAG: YetF domain-containing protein [Anaerolineaceae bacterium]